MSDNVEKPNHYVHGGMECIDAIRAALTPEEFRGYCKGNMIKYVWRERDKGGDEDLEKAGEYSKFAVEAGESTADRADDEKFCDLTESLKNLLVDWEISVSYYEEMMTADYACSEYWFAKSDRLEECVYDLKEVLNEVIDG